MVAALALGCPAGDQDESSESSGSSGESSGTAGAMIEPTGEACEDPETDVLWGYDGALADPMELGDAGQLGIQVARSQVAEEGTLTLSFSTTCAGPIYLWALVWDSLGGVDMENADSLYYSVDGGEEQAWNYGCFTDGTDERWWWLPLDSWSMTDCDHNPFELMLPVGEHTIVVRNREAGGGPNVAAIAAVVYSHDPEVDLTQYIDPLMPMM